MMLASLPSPVPAATARPATMNTDRPKIHIELDPETLWGGSLWWSLDDWCFPEPGWWDMPYISIEAWVQGILDLVRGEEPVATLDFYEGPFYVELRPVGSTFWEVHFLEDRAGKPALTALAESRLTPIVEREIIIGELFQAAEQVIAHRDYNTRDPIRKLESKVEQLRLYF